MSFATIESMKWALAIFLFLVLSVPFSRASNLSRGEDRLGVPAPPLSAFSTG